MKTTLNKSVSEFLTVDDMGNKSRFEIENELIQSKFESRVYFIGFLLAGLAALVLAFMLANEAVK